MAFAAAPEFRGALLAFLFAVPLGAAQAADFRPLSGPTPPLLLDRLDGPDLALADAAGRPVIVHFFATWCAPCIPEMAALADLAARRQGQPLAIVAVSVAEVDAAVRRFVASRPTPVPVPVLMDRDRSAARAWGVQSLPTSFLLDADHAPAFVADGEVAWMSDSVNTLLDQLIATVPAREKSDDEAT